MSPFRFLRRIRLFFVLYYLHFFVIFIHQGIVVFILIFFLFKKVIFKFIHNGFKGLSFFFIDSSKWETIGERRWGTRKRCGLVNYIWISQRRYLDNLELKTLLLFFYFYMRPNLNLDYYKYIYLPKVISAQSISYNIFIALWLLH